MERLRVVKTVSRPVTPAGPPAGFISLSDFFDCQEATDTHELPVQSEVLELVRLGITVKDAVQVVSEVGARVHRRLMAVIRTSFPVPQGENT